LRLYTTVLQLSKIYIRMDQPAVKPRQISLATSSDAIQL
jgi:hypothetical protein